MKNLVRFTLLTGIIAACLTFTASSAIMQKSNDLKDSEINFEDFVKVTLITNSDNYELKKGEKIPVTVRISNTSNGKLILYEKPFFNIRRVGVEKYKTKVGDSYTGRIVSQNSSKPENLCLDKGEYLDFEADIIELELKDGMSSINSWENPFQVLEDGKYNLQVEVVIDFSKDGKEEFKDYLSNSITISYKNDVKN